MLKNGKAAEELSGPDMHAGSSNHRLSENCCREGSARAHCGRHAPGRSGARWSFAALLEQISRRRQVDRRRHPRLRDAGRRSRAQTWRDRPRCARACPTAVAGDDDQPLLLARACRRSRWRRTVFGAGSADVICRGWQRVDEYDPDGGQQVRAESMVRRHRPEVYMGMGLTAERLAAEVRHHARRRRTRSRCAAIRTRCRHRRTGSFDEEIVPVEVSTTRPR